MTAGRNDSCPCGSGKKLKKCCGKADTFLSSPLHGNQSTPPQSMSVRPPDRSSAPTPAESEQLVALFQVGRHAELNALARKLIERHPHFGFVWKIWGVSLQLQGKAEALHALQRASALLPDDVGAHSNLGNVLLGLGRHDEAIAIYQRALILKPDFAEACFNLGIALKARGQIDGALLHYRRALAIKNDYTEAHYNLGNALREQKRFDDAVESYQQALKIKPNYAEAHYNLSLVLRALGRHEETVSSCKQALILKPDYAEAHCNLGSAYRDLGRPDDGLASYRRALEINPDFIQAHSNLLFTLQFVDGISMQDLFVAHRSFSEYFEESLKLQWVPHDNSRASNRRLKIGYVSGDFRQHAVAFFIEPVLVNHDKSEVEVFCYANSSIRDAVTERLCAVVDHWIVCSGLTDDELAQRIRTDRIDILMDLSGHTANNRLLTFARKPAPIQITYLGYPGGSGLSAMDYRLTDHYTEPGDDQYYIERLIRLPHSLWCYKPTASMPEVTPLPALVNGYLTFGSFNNFNKINESCIILWAALLRSLPSARLLMVTVPEGKSRVRLARQFAELGIASDRIDYCGSLPSQEFQRKLQQVDITLDPFPVNGATTTCESLWLGVPVLTLVGQRFLSRAGYSILSAAQLPEFVVETPEELIATATRLANDLPRLAEIRMGMRERLKDTPLLDQQRFTRNLEGIYRDVWEAYLSA